MALIPRMGSELHACFLAFVCNSHAEFLGNKGDLGIICMLGLTVQDLVSRVDGMTQWHLE